VTRRVSEHARNGFRAPLTLTFIFERCANLAKFADFALLSALCADTSRVFRSLRSTLYFSSHRSGLRKCPSEVRLMGHSPAHPHRSGVRGTFIFWRGNRLRTSFLAVMAKHPFQSPGSRRISVSSLVYFFVTYEMLRTWLSMEISWTWVSLYVPASSSPRIVWPPVPHSPSRE